MTTKGIYNTLVTQLDKTARGHKLLVPDGVPTDRAINGLQ